MIRRHRWQATAWAEDCDCCYTIKSDNNNTENREFIMMPTLLSLVSLVVVIMTSPGAASMVT